MYTLLHAGTWVRCPRCGASTKCGKCPLTMLIYCGLSGLHLGGPTNYKKDYLLLTEIRVHSGKSSSWFCVNMFVSAGEESLCNFLTHLIGLLGRLLSSTLGVFGQILISGLHPPPPCHIITPPPQEMKSLHFWADLQLRFSKCHLIPPPP